MNDRLQQMFNLQNMLQSGTYGDGKEPGDYSIGGKIEFIKTNILALTDELHEALAEVGWKPWASSKHINEDAYKAELVDAWHFFMNLCLVVNMTPDELHTLYVAKREKNIKRQTDGYDGVATKCPICKRALDDDAVDCFKAPNGNTIGWCEKIQNYYTAAELSMREMQPTLFMPLDKDTE